MTKTKFLSKVLAVLMALSMLCSTGVLADYDRGLTAGETAVTGVIEMTGTRLNGGIAFWTADSVAKAKWFDVADGLTLTLKGTASAQTGTLTYAIAPVDTFATDPFDPVLMENTAVAIGAEEFTGGAFDLTIKADPAKLVKNTTYELRLAYSKTELVDVTDASAVVYQRYFKSFDWADATVKSTNVVNKAGIGDITIDIEGNPIREFKGSTADKKIYADAVKYIRTDNLQNGSILQIKNASSSPETLLYGQTEKIETSNRSRIVMDVGSELLGGVVLGYSGGSGEHDEVNRGGNTVYRFKATQSGTVYLVGGEKVAHPDWAEIKGDTTVSQPYHVQRSSAGFLYVKPETEGAEGTFTMMASKTAASKTGLKLDESWYTPERYLKLPTANLDENGNWKYGMGTNGTGTPLSAETAPYTMYSLLDFGSTDTRGFVYQGLALTDAYERTFEAGEWVEVPYPHTQAYTVDAYAIIQFDVPKQPLTTAVVKSTLSDMYAYNTSASGTKVQRNTDAGTETITFPAGTEEAVIKVPYGTYTATATITNALGKSAEVTATFGTAARITTDTFETSVTIGGEEYDVTIKWDDTYPYVINYVDSKSYYTYANRNFVMRADGVNQIWASSQIGNKNLGGYTETDAEGLIANAGAANTNIVINGTALANNGYLSVINVNYSDAFYRAKQAQYTDDFHKIAKVETDKWTTFVPSANGTVYVTVTHANAGTKSFVWKEGAAAGWTREESATFNDAVVYVYSKRVTAGETVKVPSQVITQDEIDYINTKIAAKDAAANDGYNYRYILTDETGAISSTKGVHAVMQYSTDGGTTWTNVVTADSSTGRFATVNGVKNVQGDYMRGQNNGINTRTGAPYGRQNFFLVVAFDQPFAMGDVSYTIGEDTATVDFAGATEKTITIPYGTESVSLDATWSGAGEVVVEPATLTFSDAAATQTATITATPAGGAATTYSVTFKWDAPSLIWESAIAPTGKLQTHTQGPSNRRSLYAQGLYKVGEQSGSVELSEDNTTVDLVVPYGVEVVKMNGGVSVNLLAAENHAATTTLTLAGVEYTVNVSWAPYAYDAANTEKPLLYDLEYFVDGKTALYADTRYYAIPTNLVLDADHDLVLGEGDLKGTNEAGKLTVDQAEGTWFTEGSHKNINLSSTNAGNAVNRLHLAPKAFETWVENGDLDSIYALNGATYIAADYTDVVAHNAVRYRFKTATSGYVIVASRNANTALTAADGWVRLEGNKLPFTNGSTSANTADLKRPPEGHKNAATSFAMWSGACNYIYMKKVDANEVIEVKESTVAGDYPPVVIVATEDMIKERVVAPTLLASLSYTTELAVTNPKESDAANARGENKKSLHAGGYYQPTLVTEAATVEVAADATTVNVTVPYGSEIVKLAGVDTKDGAVTFDEAINLINNNGAVTLTKTVGAVEYTINVAWAAYDASADAAGNMVYDVKYRVKDLAADGYYNAIPTKLSLTETRVERGTVDLYATEDLAKVVAPAGTWVYTNTVLGKNSNATVHNNGGTIARGRLTVDGFAKWVKSGLLTVSGVPAVPNAEDVDTDAEVDAIAYAAMNGATTLVFHYTDFGTAGAASGANAEMGARMSFRVAQDSIVYVTAKAGYNPGEGWTYYKTGRVDTINLNARDSYFMAPTEEGGAPTKTSSVAYDLASSYAGENAYYRYVRAGELVTFATETVADNQFTPVIFVRAMDFSNLADPTVSNFTFTADKAEAAGVEFEGSATTATVTVPFGTESVSLNAVMSGAGSLTFSDALTLSKDNREGTITATLENAFGTVVATYEVTFVWGAAPAVEAVTYETSTTIYKVATVKDVALDAETQTVEVPWGTAYATVSYKFEGQDAVKLAAVNVISGTGSVDVELPEETITITFVWGAAPAGQYITGLTKTANNWRDRMFVSYGDLDNAHVAGNSGYEPTGSKFFFDDDVDYSGRVPAGLAKRGEVAVIADAAANVALSHMTSSSFPYMYNATYSGGTEAANSWLTFTVAKDGMLYFAPSSRDEVWAEGEAAGWTVAPFGLKWASGERKLYQKKVSAGEIVYLPNNVVTQAEVDFYNDKLNGYDYVAITQEDIDDLKVAVKEENAEYKLDGVAVGDLIAKYTDEYIAAGEGVGQNFRGFRVTAIKSGQVQFMHYTRENNYVLFAVADDNVAAELKAPKYTGDKAVYADESIELKAEPTLYGFVEGEITFEIKEGAEYAYIEGNTLVAPRDKYVDDAKVVITMKQGEVEADVTIDILPISASKYGYLTVEIAGEGSVNGYIGEEAIFEGEVKGKEFAMGEVVTLEAVYDDTAYEFAYWLLIGKSSESIYSTEELVDVRVPSDIKLQAVFKAKSEENYTVKFLGYQKALISVTDTASVDGNVILVPSAPEVYGYEFAGFTSSITGEEVLATGTELPLTLFKKDVTFTAVYNLKATMEYKLTVVNGTIKGKDADEATEAMIPYNTSVTVVANEEEGKFFKQWIDDKGQVLSYDKEFRFYMASERTVTAEYSDTEAGDPTPVITMTVATVDEAAAGGAIYALFSERRVPEGYTVVQSGIVYGYAGNAYGLTEESDYVTLENYTGKKDADFQNNNGQYMVRFQMTPTRAAKGTWYASTYLIYRDENGNQFVDCTPKKLIGPAVEAE